MRGAFDVPNAWKVHEQDARKVHQNARSHRSPPQPREAKSPFEGSTPELVGSAAEFRGGNPRARGLAPERRPGRGRGPMWTVPDGGGPGGRGPGGGGRVGPGRPRFEGSTPELVGSAAEFRGGNPHAQGLAPETGPGRGRGTDVEGSGWRRSGWRGVGPGRPRFEGSTPELVGSAAEFRGGNPHAQGLTPEWAGSRAGSGRRGLGRGVGPGAGGDGRGSGGRAVGPGLRRLRGRPLSWWVRPPNFEGAIRTFRG